MNTEYKISGEKPLSFGKTKEIWAVEHHDDLIIMKNTDATTADNDASKTQLILDKGKCATITTSRIFELLEQAGIPTAYVQQLSDTEILAKKCTMLPLEVIIRRFDDGSSLERKPHRKTTGNPHRFHRLVFELFLKTSKGKLGEMDLRNYLPLDKEDLIKYLNVEKSLKEINEKRVEKKLPKITKLMELSHAELIEEAIKLIDDPWIANPYDIENWTLKHPKKPEWEIPQLTTMNGLTIVKPDQLKKIEELTRKTFLILEGAWNTLGYRLIDFKIEFGIDADDNLLIADVIDNDSWRLRTADWKELSKQNFRDGHPLAQVQEKYVRVAELTNQLRIPQQAIIFWRGSDKDELESFHKMRSITYEDVVISGHKSPNKALQKLEDLHAQYPEGAVIIAIVGMSNGLGPTDSARTYWPVLSYCNTAKTNPEDVWSSLRMPSEVPNATFLNIKNAYLAALNILAAKNPIAYMNRQLAIEKLDE